MNVPRLRISLILALTILLVFLYARRDNVNAWTAGGPVTTSTSAEIQNALREIGFTKEFEYQRICLRPVADKNLLRSNHDHIEANCKVLTEPTRLSVADIEIHASPGKQVLPPCHRTINLNVPGPEDAGQPDFRTLVLGMATSLSRLEQSLPEMAQWLAGTGSQLFVILRDINDVRTTATDAVKQLARDLNIKLTLVSHVDIAGSQLSAQRRDEGQQDGQATTQSSSESEEPSNEATSNFGLAPLISAKASSSTKWLLILDDDTYAPSLAHLLSSLAPFDPSKPHYIGALSERHLGMQTEGFKAWGGAGIILSMPLVHTLATNYTSCISMARTWGDALWRDCIATVTSPTVQLEQLPGLNQMDMFPDVSGWYESSPWPLLSLHHWKSWHSFSLPEHYAVSAVVGREGFLARWVWREEGLVLSNGYSIVRYPQGVPDLGLVEGTMTAYPDANEDDGVREYRFSMGRLRRRLGQGKEKVSWLLERTVRTGEGVTQIYVRRMDSALGWTVDSAIHVDWVT